MLQQQLHFASLVFKAVLRVGKKHAPSRSPKNALNAVHNGGMKTAVQTGNDDPNGLRAATDKPSDQAIRSVTKIAGSIQNTLSRLVGDRDILAAIQNERYGGKRHPRPCRNVLAGRSSSHGSKVGY